MPDDGTFVHLHTHSEYSSLDGLSTVQEIVDRAVLDNQPAVAITDHGVCAAHPHLSRVAGEAGIKPIFGIEANFVNDRMRRGLGLPDGRKKSDLNEAELLAYDTDLAEVKDYWHLILWAETDEGLHNLWAMSTEANRDGYYARPRMDWDTLQRHSAGVLCSTACLRGPITQAIVRGDEDAAISRMARLQAIFPDRLYVELHTNTEEDQIKANPALVDLASRFSVPIVAVTDSHYSCMEHEAAHHAWIAAQTGKTINDDSGMFKGTSQYHVMTEAEVRKSLSYLPDSVVSEAIANTVLVADRCDTHMKANPAPPVFSPPFAHHDPVADDVNRLLKVCMDNWKKLNGKTHTLEEYEDRFAYEFGLLVDKGFCGYFLIVSDYCLWAKRQGILIGPGRGSGGGSLVAYLSGITDIDPVETDLLFERFMTKGRTELPDFDVDFPSSRIDEVLQFIADKWGEDCVVRVGTHIRLKNKGVIRKLAGALKDSIDINWGDIEIMSKIITKAESGSAGLGISWDELMTEYETEFKPYRTKYPVLFELADIFVGRLNAYGKHAAGVVISPRDNLTTRLPLRVGDDDRLIAEYDMDALAFLGLVKFDFLAVTTLDTLQMTIDLVKARTGEVIDPYSWKTEYEDEEVWKFLSAGNTKGCFQIETPAGTKITKDLKPQNMHDLADVITLDRPGPMRSGLDQAYLRRRHGKEAVTFVDPRLETVLNRSYGVLLYQEDIMKTCMVLAGYDDEQADKVRKILGKKKVELAREEGAKFINAAIERGMDPNAAERLWAQMEEFARYSFNRAHAYGYAMLSYWCAYLKYHHPQEFYVAAMSMLDSDNKSKIVDFVSEAKSRGYQVLPPDINASGKDFTIVGTEIRYGLGSVLGIGDVAVDAIIKAQPYESYADFREKKPVNIGIARKLIQVGAFDSFGCHRGQLLAELEHEESGDDLRCAFFNEHKQGAPNGLPCDFDWTSEPERLGARGKPLKQKPIPTKCTVRCRNYTQGEPKPVTSEPWSEVQIRNAEMELLGVHLSSTPFDKANEEFGDEIWRASQLEAEDTLAQACLIGIVKQVREKLDKRGKPFAIVSLFAQDGTVDAACFNWKELKPLLKESALVMAVVSKNVQYGYQLLDAAPAESVV